MLVNTSIAVLMIVVLQFQAEIMAQEGNSYAAAQVKISQLSEHMQQNVDDRTQPFAEYIFDDEAILAMPKYDLNGNLLTTNDGLKICQGMLVNYYSDGSYKVTFDVERVNIETTLNLKLSFNLVFHDVKKSTIDSMLHLPEIHLASSTVKNERTKLRERIEVTGYSRKVRENYEHYKNISDQIHHCIDQENQLIRAYSDIIERRDCNYVTISTTRNGYATFGSIPSRN